MLKQKTFINKNLKLSINPSQEGQATYEQTVSQMSLDDQQLEDIDLKIKGLSAQDFGFVKNTHRAAYRNPNREILPSEFLDK